MWIVKLALRRSYTFAVMAILILVMGLVAIFRTPTDIFPNINIPVVSIIWNYNGLVPKDVSDRIVSVTNALQALPAKTRQGTKKNGLVGIR